MPHMKRFLRLSSSTLRNAHRHPLRFTCRFNSTEVSQQQEEQSKPEEKVQAPVYLTKNSHLFPPRLSMRKFPGYIQPKHYKLGEKQLRTEFDQEMEKIAAPVLGVDPPVQDLEMGTRKIKFEITSQATAHFGREIPLKELSRMRTVKDVTNFFVKQVVSEVPPPAFHVPKNVALFIKKHSKKREIIVRKRMMQVIGDRKRRIVESTFKRYFRGPAPNLTDEEINMYLKNFRRIADDKLFKKRMLKKYNPRKIVDSRIDYDRPHSRESENVFKHKNKDQL